MEQNTIKNLFAFVLGRETKIALTELESVLRSFDVCFSILSVTGNIAIINIKTQNFGSGSILFKEAESPEGAPVEGGYQLETKNFIRLLGGTVKIFEIVGKGSNNLINDIVKIVQENSVNMIGKLNLGISDYRSNPTTTNNINKIGLSIKNILKKSHNTRFVAVKDGYELASIVSYKNKLDCKGIEIGIFQAGIGRLVAITNPEEWSKRDYDKPKGDKYSGMTPPKLARALVNIALSQAISNYQFPISNENSKIDKLNENCELKIENYQNCVVVDPFCGSGNILMEAVMLGCGVIGFDISEKAVNDTKANLHWLKSQITNHLSTPSTTLGTSSLEAGKLQTNSNNQISNSENYGLKTNDYKLFQADATRYDFSQIFTHDAMKSFCIVTEPYLGQPKKFEPSLNAVKGEYQKVKKLYLDFLSNLKAKSCKLEAICVIFPLVETQEGKQYSLLNESIDEIKEMGYTLTCEPMVYGREYQVVKREIVFLKITNIKSQNTNKLQIQN